MSKSFNILIEKKVDNNLNKNKSVKKIFKTILMFIVFLVIVIIFGINRISYIYINDATIESSSIPFFTKISGQIIELNVDNNQNVKKGEIIGRINSESYQLALQNSQDNLKKAYSDLKISSKDIEKINKVASIDKSNMQNAKINLEEANSDYVRYKNAYQDGSVTKQDLENAIENLEIARSDYKTAQDNLKIASKNLQSNLSKKAIQNTKIKKIINEIEKNKLNLSNATLIAPIDGTISNKAIKNLDYVEANQQLLTIVQNEYYIIAKFNEKQLKHIKKGQQILVTINSLNLKNLKGVIDSSEELNNSKKCKIKFIDDVSNYNITSGMKISLKIKIR